MSTRLFSAISLLCLIPGAAGHARASAPQALPTYEICRQLTEAEECIRFSTGCPAPGVQLTVQGRTAPCAVEGAEACGAAQEFLEETARKLKPLFRSRSASRSATLNCNGFSLIARDEVYIDCLGTQPAAEDVLFRAFRHVRSLCE